MQTEDEYKGLLTRLRESLPETITAQTRFKIPDPEVLYEGKTTVFRNFGEIVDAINRESSHLMAFLLKEVGTAGNQEGRRALRRLRRGGAPPGSVSGPVGAAPECVPGLNRVAAARYGRLIRPKRRCYRRSETG